MMHPLLKIPHQEYRNNIPCIGFGPGAEAQAHAPNEKTWKQDLVTCAAVYAALPKNYME